MNMNNIFKKILNEAFFDKKDIDDHEFDYFRQVLDNLKNNDTISLKTKGSNRGIKTSIKHLKSDEFKNNITRFQNWLNNDGELENVGTLNDYKNAENVENARYHLLKSFFNSFNIEFTNIEKTDYSIIRTPEQEGIQAIFLAARIKGKGNKDFDDFNNILNEKGSNWASKCDKIKDKLYKNDLGITLTNDEIDFSKTKNQDVLKKLVNILKIEDLKEFKNLSNTEFTIIHPDGLKNTDSNVAELTKVLFGGNVKWEVKNQNFKLSLQKDNFIPADLYIIPLNKIKDIKEIIDAAGKLDPYSMVGLSNKLMGTGDMKLSEPLIYPISLKMPSNNPKIKKIINLKNENTIKVGIGNIPKEGIHFNPEGNSTMEIKYNDGDGDKTFVLEFRSKGKDKTGKHQLWQCNALNKNNTNAIEGGSAKNYMKFVFRDYMVGSITEADVDRIVEVFGNRIRIDKRVNKIQKQKESVLVKSFKRFFEDEDIIEENEDNIVVEENEVDKKEDNSTLTANDMVLLAVPSNPKVRGESSAKEGNIGLGLFCKKLIDNGIEGSGNYNKEFSEIIQMSFKMNDIVQDTWKIT